MREKRSFSRWFGGLGAWEFGAWAFWRFFVMGVFSWINGEKILYYPGCVRNEVSQGGLVAWWFGSLELGHFGGFL